MSSRITHVYVRNEGTDHVIRHNGDLLYAVVLEFHGIAAREIDKQRISVTLPDKSVQILTIKSDRSSPRRK